jgi:hypothetical protein
MNNRVERLIFFLVVWLTMFSCIFVQAQNSYVKASKFDFLLLKYPGDSSSKIYSNLSSKQAVKWESIQVFGYEPIDISAYFKVNYFNEFNWHLGSAYVQPPNLYYIQSGLFCKGEWELEKATHIPFRFRLGSLADCNALEGKH